MLKTILKSKSKAVIFVDEEASYLYNPGSGEIEQAEQPGPGKKPLILSDNYVELKNLFVPIVSAKLLPDILFNTIKKYLTYTPAKSDIDFEIIGRSEKEYELAVFINKYPGKQTLTGRKVYTVYDIVDKLARSESYPEDCCFIVQESHALFVYHFKGRKFTGREILFEDDLSSLQTENCYFIHANTPGENVEHQYPVLKWDILGRVLSGFSVTRFAGKKLVSFSLIMYILCALVLLGSVISGEVFLKGERDYLATLTTSINKLNETYRLKKSDSSFKSEEYNRVLELVRKKSNINAFFNYLYETAGDSIKIKNVQYSKPTFVITGVCKSDSMLENSFHTRKLWRNINITFTKKSTGIAFRVEGEFIYDQ